MNLGWKLAPVVTRTSPDSLLETYHAERHPVAARVLRSTMARVALLRTDALRDIVSEVVSLDEPRKRLAGRGCAAGMPTPAPTRELEMSLPG